jgi:hypothetical protein
LKGLKGDGSIQVALWEGAEKEFDILEDGCVVKEIANVLALETELEELFGLQHLYSPRRTVFNSSSAMKNQRIS